MRASWKVFRKKDIGEDGMIADGLVGGSGNIKRVELRHLYVVRLVEGLGSWEESIGLQARRPIV